jgi:hypothetical protein
MHIELTPEQALQVARHLNECAEECTRAAIADDAPPSQGAFRDSGQRRRR